MWHVNYGATTRTNTQNHISHSGYYNPLDGRDLEIFASDVSIISI